MGLLMLVLVASMGGVRAQEPAPAPLTTLSPIVANVPNAGRHLMQASTWQPFEVRGVNYVRVTDADPQLCSELHFGGVNSLCPWDSTLIAADMDRLRSRGVNTVRVFLNFYAFGGFRMNYPSYRIEPALNHLEEFITIANRRNIYVMPVLLAKYPQDSHFGVEDFWMAMNWHVSPIVERFAGHPGILAWDIFNEPDIAGPVDVRCWDWDNGAFPLCFNLATERMLFLNMLRDEVKRLDFDKPVTVSVAFAKSYFRPEGAYSVRLADLVDFYSFHYYDNDPYDSGRYEQHWYYGAGFPQDFERSINELEALNLDKPIVVTEVGFPSGAGAMRTLEETHRDLRTVMRLSREKGISGVVLWPFQPTPEEVIGDVFW
jgi:exo-beta-1,3-glucanase (GH17 family)